MNVKNMNASLELSSLHTQRGSSNNGHRDQWQRSLEKAYFEKQTELLASIENRSVAVSANEYERAGRFTNTEETVAPLIKEYSINEIYDPCLELLSKKTIVDVNIVEDQLVKNAVKKPIGVDASLSINDFNLKTESTVKKQDDSKIDVGSLIKRELSFPDKSHVSILTTEHGIHLVIRDESMTAERIRTLSKQLFSYFERNGKSLWRVTLNGEDIFREPNIELDPGRKEAGRISSYISKIY
ncbi:hypothetical protein KQ940_06585 [Marinobacterium sp. D7]|uniref:hypothetical protein n=1 Tax=Marinobacterium ramblicola TaxID=2849041 RepID=UPI001C2D13D2|nr:hypothetical protein [Marinobacterium ramblicola]MBV1787720.1 hypothetical protein [Marinobacterium ramblicola]